VKHELLATQEMKGLHKVTLLDKIDLLLDNLTSKLFSTTWTIS
jgi:hypothetical protein